MATKKKKQTAEKQRKQNKNLTHVLTAEDHSKGGKKSGEVRRQRKQFKQELIDALSTGNVQKNITAALIKKAMSGDVKAFCVIRDTIGESPDNVLPEIPDVVIVDDI